MKRFRNIFRTHQKLLAMLLGGVFLGMPLTTHAVLGLVDSSSLPGLIISVVGFVLWIGANMLDAAVNWFILGMGGLINGTGGIGIGPSIDLIWAVVRDLVNLTFIFGLVYVGFKTILSAGTDTKKLLSSIIICALLVNFSLFISKVVIDVSNVTASQIYKQMGIGANATGNVAASNSSISTQFMTQMGIVQLVSVPTAQTAGNTAQISTLVTGSITFAIGAAIFILVAAFVFAAGAVLIAIRFGVLVIIMMLSPIFFAATVFPVFSGWRDKWLHSLLSQAFFAPAYLFMLYVTLKVAEGYQSQTANFDKIYSNLGKEYSHGFASLIFFSLTIVLMVASLILAKQMGAIGATRALAVGKKASVYTGTRLERSRGGRFAKGLVSVASLGTFTERTRRKVFEAGTKSKFGGNYSFAEDMEWKRQHDKQKGIYDDIQNGEKATARAKAAPAGTPVSGDDKKLIEALRKAIGRRSTKDLEEMQVSLLSNENIAVHITGEQMKNIRKNENGKFSVDDIKKIDDARTKALEAAVGRDSTVGFGEVQGPKSLATRGENELKQLPIEKVLAAKDATGTFYPMAPYITPRMIEYILQEGATSDEETALRAAVQDELNRRPVVIGVPLDPYRAKFKKWVEGNNPYGPGFGLTGL